MLSGSLNKNYLSSIYLTDFLFFFLQDDEFNEILHSSERIEFLYGHLFDEVIVNDDLTTAFAQLVTIVNKVENEPLWIPASWI